MNNEEIINGNKLIAEFMGFKNRNGCFIIPEFERYKKTDDGIILDNWFWDDELKYHSSWDWLMPVVDKIESLGYHVQIGIASATAGASNTKCAVISKFTDFGHFDMYNKYFYPPQYGWSVKSTKRESCWNACIEFIKWYNENKKE